MMAVPALTPVMTLSTMETIVGSDDANIHLPVEFDCGVTGVVSFSPTPTASGLKAPIVGGVPITRTSKVIEVAV